MSAIVASEWERHRSYPEPDGGIVWFPQPVFDVVAYYRMKATADALGGLPDPPCGRGERRRPVLDALLTRSVRGAGTDATGKPLANHARH